MKKIGMIVAMEKELTPFLSTLGNIELLCETPYPVHFVRTKGKELYIAESGVGEIYAAGAVQFLATKYEVEAIVNFGVVGGLTEEMDYNRVVLVEKVVHYAFDTSAIDPVPVGQYFHRNDLYFHCDSTLLATAKKALPDCKTVTLASADRFVASAQEKEKIATDFCADICDMESAGVALTAENNRLPYLFVKAVSDSKNDGNAFCQLVQGACRNFESVILSLLNALS